MLIVLSFICMPIRLSCHLTTFSVARLRILFHLLDGIDTKDGGNAARQLLKVFCRLSSAEQNALVGVLHVSGESALASTIRIFSSSPVEGIRADAMTLASTIVQGWV